MSGEVINFKQNKLLYPELSYKINGVMFEVYKQLGPGHHEKYYQKAIAIGFKNIGLKYEEQYYVPLKMDGEIVGKYFLDFLVEGKIIVEIKRGKLLPFKNIQQTKQYLSALNLKLAIIVSFTYDGAIINRVLNEY
ncbi:MAG: GxxExxY protein [Candidatus Magasanikiibacteriota bacterium]